VLKNRRVPHAVAWVRKGFAAIEEYERAQEERRGRAASDDPDEVAMAVLQQPLEAPVLPASGDMWGISTLSFTLPPELRDRGGPIPPRERAKAKD